MSDFIIKKDLTLTLKIRDKHFRWGFTTDSAPHTTSQTKSYKLLKNGLESLDFLKIIIKFFWRCFTPNIVVISASCLWPLCLQWLKCEAFICCQFNTETFDKEMMLKFLEFMNIGIKKFCCGFAPEPDIVVDSISGLWPFYHFLKFDEKVPQNN